MCDPIVGCITYSAGLLSYLLVISIKDLDEGENPIFSGNAYNIFRAIHFFGWLTQIVGHGVYESKYK